MINYNNPYERSRHNKNKEWWEEKNYRAGRDGNRDQYDEYPRFGGQERVARRENDLNNYDQEHYRREHEQYNGDDRWQNMQRGYGSYAEDDGSYGEHYNSNQYGNYGNRGYNEGQQSYRGDYGRQHHSGYSDRENQRVFNRGNNAYRGEFGDSRDYMREGGYGNEQRYGYHRKDNNRRDDDRSFWDKTTDEVATWFGDEDAERRRRVDKIQEAMHRGRGPKGYKRSDDRVLEDINDRLGDDPWIDASDVEVIVANGEVTLTGNVTEKLAKRRAEDIAESVSGVINVENRLKVAHTGKDSYRNSSFNTDI